MSNALQSDPVAIQNAANDTHTQLKELETNLIKLSNVQDDLHDAVQSQHLGAAIYAKLGDAWHQGKSIGATLESIEIQLRAAGASIDESDITGAGSINNSANTGDWSQAAAGKIDPSKMDA
ncbi:hypothetical protein ACFXO9_30970 [Nocardia tengchongensis]|uniref:hypothetical protein n=1 Tax=Nocardia tengchongensis TaxID=2055889 RepID=UPI0036AD7FB0